MFHDPSLCAKIEYMELVLHQRDMEGVILKMDHEVFADGVSNISIDGGVVRLDLVSLSPTVRDENQKPVFAFKQRVVLPLDGFLRSFSAMEGFVKQLMKSGVVKTTVPETTEKTATTGEPKSPNFS